LLLISCLLNLASRSEASGKCAAPIRQKRLVLFAEGLLEIIPERFDEIVHRTTLRGEDEGFGGHAWDKHGTLGKLGKLACIESNFCAVIGCPVGLINEGIGRYGDDLAVELWRTALIKG